MQKVSIRRIRAIAKLFAKYLSIIDVASFISSLFFPTPLMY